MFYVGGEVLRKHKDIVHVYKSIRNVAKNLVHKPLECVSGVPETKRHDEELEHPKLRDDRRLLYVPLHHGHLIIALHQI